MANIATDDLMILTSLAKKMYQVRPNTRQIVDSFIDTDTFTITTPQELVTSYDGKYLAVAGGTSPYFQLFDLTTGLDVTPAGYDGLNVNRLEFSYDSSKLVISRNAASGTKKIAILDMVTLTWDDLTAFTIVDDVVVQHAKISPDGTYIAYYNGRPTGNKINIHLMSDYSFVASVDSHTSGGATQGFVWTNNDHIVTANNLLNGFRVYAVGTWSEVTGFPTISGSAYGWYASPYIDDIIMIRLGAPFAIQINTTDWTARANLTEAFTSLPEDIDFTSDGKKMTIMDSGSNTFEYTYNPSSLVFEDAKEITVPGNTRYQIAYIKGGRWEVIGSIDENLAETNWICSAYDLATDVLLKSVITSTPNFTIPLASPDPVKVTVSPTPFGIWSESSSIGLNDRIYPTDPENTPYYYKCTTSGTTASTEPTWPVTTNSTVTDGSVVWEIVERIIQPITHAPLVPTVVV